MDNNSNKEKKISKYNAAVAQLYRLDELWRAADLHSRSGNLFKWNWDLDAIWRELAGDATGGDGKSYKKYNDLIGRYSSKKAFLYQILQKKHIWLKKIENAQGKGTAYEDPLEDYMG